MSIEPHVIDQTVPISILTIYTVFFNVKSSFSFRLGRQSAKHGVLRRSNRKYIYTLCWVNRNRIRLDFWNKSTTIRPRSSHFLVGSSSWPYFYLRCWKMSTKRPSSTWTCLWATLPTTIATTLTRLVPIFLRWIGLFEKITINWMYTMVELKCKSAEKFSKLSSSSWNH